MSIRKEQLVKGSGHFKTLRERYSADEQVEWYHQSPVELQETVEEEILVTTPYRFEDTSFDLYKGWVAQEFIPAREGVGGNKFKPVAPELVVFSVPGLEDTTVEMSAKRAVEQGLLGSIRSISSRPISMTEYSIQTLERKLERNGFY